MNDVTEFRVIVSFGLTQCSLVDKVLSLLEEGSNRFSLRNFVPIYQILVSGGLAIVTDLYSSLEG